jgi:hypothetical protein
VGKERGACVYQDEAVLDRLAFRVCRRQVVASFAKIYSSLTTRYRQVLSFCIVGTNTFSALLSMDSANIPAFQTFFNYVLLNIVWTSVTIYKYGFNGWLRMIYKDGWRYLILSFCDVEGNYFTVLGFRYVSTDSPLSSNKISS